MNRIDKVRQLLNDFSLDAFLITHLPNIRYLTEFSGSSASVLICRNTNYFVTDFRYKTQSAKQISGFEIITDNDLLARICSILSSDGLNKIGFESSRMTVSVLERYKSISGQCTFKPIFEKIETITMQKTQGEISKMKKAAEISDMTFEKMLGFIKPGMTELEVSAEITYTQKKLGASKDAFEPIIASGWRGALPHGIASDKKIENGEMITLDFGCIYEGFCSDLTRTISVGKPVTEMKKIYDIVYEVQNKTVERVKAGMSSMKLDSEARNEIAAKGYGEHFGHGLGHGLGIEVHERPSVGQRDDVILAENSVITIEPGIYIEGLGGVRIEDDVLLKADSNEVLNKAKKELIII